MRTRPEPTNSRIAVTLCGSCGSTCDEGRSDCRHCGSDFATGAPAAIVRVHVDGLRIAPRIEFVGRWLPERRRQIEEAIAPKREAFRVLQGGKL